MEILLGLLICALLCIIPILLLWLWFKTAKQVWSNGKKWKKVIAALSLVLCIAGTIAFGVCIYQLICAKTPSEYVLLHPAYYIFAVLMFALNGILMKRERKYWVKFGLVTIVCVLCAACMSFLSIFSAMYGDFSTSKQNVTFKNKEDIEERLNIKGFPPCSFVNAYYSERDDGNIRVIFKYDGDDSASVFRFIKQLKQKHPILCNTDTENDVFLKYGTLYIDNNDKDTTYVNIRFFKNYHDGFAIAYGGVYNLPNIPALVKGSLGCTIPKCSLLSYEIHRYGPDYGWEGFFSLDRPLYNSDIRRLGKACKADGSWDISGKDGDIIIHNLVDGQYEWSITFVKGKDGGFSFAKVEYGTF